MEGGSTDQESIATETNNSSISSGIRSHKCKEFLRGFVDSAILSANLKKWLEELGRRDTPTFEVPFELIDLQKFGYALEGVSFQQLIRMPSGFCASTSGAVEAATYLAIEDFLHASMKGLWEAFWSQDEPVPFYIRCINDANLKFYQVEEAIANGKLGGLCATGILLNNPRHPHGKWDDILQLALIRPNIRSLQEESDRKPSLPIIGEALFYALRILLSRSLSNSNTSLTLNSVFVLLVDSQYGGLLKVEGDLSKLKFGSTNAYECAADWIKDYSRIAVSPINRIWNDLGNANWGDIGALQLLFATFHSILQFAGMPRNSIEDLAADHSSRIQIRRAERQLGDDRINGNGLLDLQQRTVSPEIVEEESKNLDSEKLMKVEVGSVLWLEDTNRQNGYLVNEILSNEATPFYIACPVEDQGEALFLYVGSHRSQMESAVEDMNLWYQVQRQIKILSIMKQKGLSSKYLPHLSSSGRIIHPGHCQRPTSGGNCNHPWCGTPILVTSPVGRTVADLMADGQFGPEEIVRCCHDCLTALSTAASAGIRHGDLRPENVICVSTGLEQPHFVLIGWGHAILEDRDRPPMNLHFSSTYALQEGKLCSASDAESLVYLLYFCSGGELPELDSVEGALQWRETSWSKRIIQQRLGNISAVVKAFADYVDSLCGTPYPMNYENWLRRLKKHMNEEGKRIGTLG